MSRHVSLLLSALVFFAGASAAHAGKLVEPETPRAPRLQPRQPDEPLELDYTFERRLPLGLRLDVSPGVAISRSAKRKVAGYTGFVAVNAFHELLVLRSGVKRISHPERPRSEWSVKLTFGANLSEAQKRVKHHVFGKLRWVAGRLF